MGFRTDLAAAKAAARVKLEKFKSKVGIEFDVDALLDRVCSILDKDGAGWASVKFEITGDHKVASVDVSGHSRGDYVERKGDVVRVAFFCDNDAEFPGLLCDWLLDYTDEINQEIAKLQPAATTPAPAATTPAPAATTTQAERIAKALRDLAEKIEKGEI